MDTAHKLPRTPKVKLTDVSVREMTATAVRERRDVEARDALVPGLRVRALRQSGHTAYLWGHGGNLARQDDWRRARHGDCRCAEARLYALLQLKAGDDPLREQAPVKAETPLTFLALAEAIPRTTTDANAVGAPYAAL